MPQADKQTLRFVRTLVPDCQATRSGDVFSIAAAGRSISLPADLVLTLVSGGVLGGSADRCWPIPATRSWLRRQLLTEDPHAAQHRDEQRRPDGGRINLSESPLARLASKAAGEAEPFLAAHQVEAGERVRRLVERAQLRPRVTMSYDPTRTASATGGSGAGDITDMAAGARRQLADIVRALPQDCADVVFDVCGLEKGLQLIETERGWPRRSAKLVLRIGLEQLALHFGLGAAARGRVTGKTRAWIEEGGRPPMFNDG